MYNYIITLVTETETINEIGDTIKVAAEREVFADIKSVGMKETYEAMGVGLKPELTFVLADYYDYDEECLIIYDGKRYKVIRTYIKQSNELEIVVTRVV